MIEAIDQFGLDYLFGSNSAFLDSIALTITNAWVWVPLYLSLIMLIIKNNDNMQQIFITIGFALLCVILVSVICNCIVKPWAERLRPCNDPAYQYVAQIAGNMHSKDYSFFSSHAANASVVATFFILLVRSKPLSFALTVWTLINCWTRVYLGQHFLTDVIVGFFFGIIIGIICYVLYGMVVRRASRRQSFVNPLYTSKGYAKYDVDISISIMLITYLYAFIAI